MKAAIFTTLLLAGPLMADVAPNKRHEIVHLLEYVRLSGCLLERNGSSYKGEQAVNHIKNKYDYFRGKIRNTEDFIRYAATKSTLSGKYYTVNCKGHTARTKDWLLKELSVYRLKRRF